MDFPENLRYTKDHEWLRMDGNEAVIGITDFAQHSLTDIVFIELPAVGKKVLQFKNLSVVESVKSVSDVFSPMSGEVVKVNTELTKKPEFINQDPYGEGWIAQLKNINKDELKNLMSADDYTKYLETAHH